MVFRVYVEKKPGFDVAAQQLANELRTILGIEALKNVRLVNRYDVEGISEELFAQPRRLCSASRRWTTSTPTCLISVPTPCSRWSICPPVRPACGFRQRVHPADLPRRASDGSFRQGVCVGRRTSEADVEAIKHYVINPVEAREASLDVKTTLKTQVPVPGKVEVIDASVL